MNVKDLKKIELHCHLDGSVRETTADSLLGRKSNMTVSPDCKDLNEYLEKFSDPVECMQTKENLKRIAKELTEDLEKDNVIYAEIRFAPMQHTVTLKPEEVVESVMDGLREGNIQTTLILCMMRGADYRTNHKVIELANKYNLPIDLAGAEALYPTKDYEQLFMEAKKLHLNYTIHAGESDGPKSIREALHFGTKRIGHGVSIVKDPKLIEYAKEKYKNLGVQTTRGLLLNGDPGVGKTLMAKATAQYLECPLVQFKIERINHKYVGESERNMRKYLDRINSMGKCVMLLTLI